FNLFLFWLISLTSISFAQSPEGALVGIVNDDTGARIAGASVTAQDLANSFTRTTTTNSLGEFLIDPLKPGDYRVTIKANNFSTSIVDVKVSVGSKPTLQVMLKAGEVKEQIEVKAPEVSLTSQPIETTSSVEKTVITNHDLISLPLSSRSFANI